MQNFLTLDEVGTMLRVEPRTVTYLVRSKQLGTLKIGRRRVVAREELDRFIAEAAKR